MNNYEKAYRQLSLMERRIQAMTLAPSSITDQYEIGALAESAKRIAAKATTLGGLMEMRSEEAAVARFRRQQEDA